MGKHGPCYHCGVTTTPLWRNGPPEKPVLCNACGSRWRTKGTLTNYTPLHARSEFDDLEEYRTPRAKSMSLNKHKEMKLPKRKPDQDSIIMVHDYDQGGLKVIDEDTSNRSSSGSAISNSESCVQFGSTDASDLTGPAQSNAWETLVPSKKRTCVNRPKQSSVEKLTKDLCTILHEQSSYFSGSYEEDILLESETPMVSVEIGHGSVLIRHPSSIARDEESEASSLSVESKQLTGAHSLSSSLILHNETNYASIPGTTEKAKNFTRQTMQVNQLKREKTQQEKPGFLGCHSSLCNIDLSDVVNFEEFVKHLTTEEQQRLLNYLPPLDTEKLPDSLRNMFESTQFKENLSYVQQLLEEGVFNISSSGVKHEDYKALKRLVLFNSTKSQWVEHHQQLKNSESSAGGFHVPQGLNATTTCNYVNRKRSHESQSQILTEGKSLKCLKREIQPPSSCNKELIESDSSCFSPRPLFAMPPVSSSFMFDSTNFVDESSDQDLLVDVPSNGSFAQAELLHPAIALGGAASTSSSSSYAQFARP